jgi:hypothetical protein
MSCAALTRKNVALSREPEPPAHEREQARVPEPEPELLTIELRERDEKLGHAVALTAEELGEAVGEVACVHAEIFARVSRASRNARRSSHEGRSDTERLDAPEARAASRRRRAALRQKPFCTRPFAKTRFRENTVKRSVGFPRTRCD